MTLFAVIYEYGATDDELATRRPEHRDYLDRLDELVLSGPWDGGRGALIVLDTASAERAEAVVAGDPFVEAGFVARHEVHAWEPVLGRLLDQV